MVVVSMVPHAEIRRNNLQENAPHFSHNNRSRLNEEYLKYFCVFNISDAFWGWSSFCRLTEHPIAFGWSNPTVNVWRTAFALDIRIRRILITVNQNSWSVEYDIWVNLSLSEKIWKMKPGSSLESQQELLSSHRVQAQQRLQHLIKIDRALNKIFEKIY